MPLFVKICGTHQPRRRPGRGPTPARICWASSSMRTLAPLCVACQRARPVRALRAELGAQANLPRLTGVFVNQPPDAVARILAFTGLDAAQLHGDEMPADLRSLAGRAYKAIRPRPEGPDWATWLEFAQLGLAPGPSLLVDAFAPAAYGGTGSVADWTLAASLAQRMPRPAPRRGPHAGQRRNCRDERAAVGRRRRLRRGGKPRRQRPRRARRLHHPRPQRRRMNSRRPRLAAFRVRGIMPPSVS